MIGRIDLWIGKTLFIPLIIRLCQLLRWTQWKMSRYSWMLFWLLLIAQWRSGTDTVVRILDGLFALIAVVAASLTPDDPIPPGPLDTFSRRMALAMFTINVLIAAFVFAATGRPSVWSTIAFLCLCVATYAKTIDTIPPLATGKEAKRVMEVRR